MKHSIVDVAKIALWMDKYVRENGYLNQHEAADYILGAFGARFLYLNKRGTLSIDREILKRFDQLNRFEVIWTGEGWRIRKECSPFGRDQSPAGEAKRFASLVDRRSSGARF